ncbi:MAG: CHC2 zinc finger domain-containing protein [Bacteroidales bacterium]|nr:CHC2 zinc finger domain-containing protein [Bacteroidales bacterium]
MISDELLERIRNANDIVDVIGEFVTLRKKGVNYVGVCPFHQDTRPSMFVSPARQIFKCFVCGTGGDVVGFLLMLELLSFP